MLQVSQQTRRVSTKKALSVSRERHYFIRPVSVRNAPGYLLEWVVFTADAGLIGPRFKQDGLVRVVPALVDKRRRIFDNQPQDAHPFWRLVLDHGRDISGVHNMMMAEELKYLDLVKPMEWHKSHVTCWNDDWHTTSPFICTIRCADEDGWRWSGGGAFGYAGTADDAKEDAQAYFNARILSAIDTTILDGMIGAINAHDELIEALQAMDAFWTESHPQGPEGDRKLAYGLGELSADTIEVWTKIRAALAKHGGA